MASRVSFMLRAFSYPNYRLFFGGQIVSLIRQLDFDDGDQLARLPADRVGHAARGRRFCGAVSRIRYGPLRRRLPRPLGPPSRAGRDADGVDAAVIHARLPDLQRTNHCARCHRAERRSGSGERVRHAGAAGVSDDDDYRSRRPRQRHRDELVDVQRRAAGRAVDRGCHDCDIGRGVVFPAWTASATSRSSSRCWR